jgi:FolB domain-containing protein
MAPNDRIELRRLVVTGICGALPEERERAQPLEVDLDVVADLSAAGASDNLDDTLDYGAITATVENVLADPRALSVTVSVRKLRPPVPQALATSGVTIIRGR